MQLNNKINFIIKIKIYSLYMYTVSYNCGLIMRELSDRILHIGNLNIVKWKNYKKYWSKC